MAPRRPAVTRAVVGGPEPIWNVVVTVSEHGFREACEFLRHWGQVTRSRYYNVLGLQVADPAKFLDDFAAAVAESPGVRNFISHVVPAQASFSFEDPRAFQNLARDVALGWRLRLAGKRFHVRLHRRGFKGILATQDEERFLDEALLAALASAGTPGRIVFDDPDAIIQIETIDGRAGMSLWTRDDLRRFPFLGVD